MRQLTALLASALVILGLPTATIASQADMDAELSNYRAVFEADDFADHRKAMDRLIWAGYSDAALFDLIEVRVNSLINEKGKANVQKASWYAKALALSGNEKYRATLQNAVSNAKSKKVRKHAALALQRLATYQKWNSIISAGLEFAPSGQLEETRVTNMLNATDYSLLKIGVKRVYYGHKTDQKLVTLAQQRLAMEWGEADEQNGEQIDAIAWLIKTMAEVGNHDAKPLLEQIAQQADVAKLRKYADKYADYL
ncbi:hypothetical protein [Arenicella xantha]|nr:hypothetical protein [Arenicella xantha]